MAQFLCFSVSLAILLLSLIQESPTAVEFEFGHFRDPFVNTTENLTIIQNSGSNIQLRCVANYPTEWVYDADDLAEQQKFRTWRIEWADRKFENSIDEPTYNYIAWMQLGHNGLQLEERYLCRSVDDHKDNILIKFNPSPNGGNLLYVTRYPKSDIVPGQLLQLPSKNEPDSGNEKCPVEFSVVSTEFGQKNYMRCLLKDGTSGNMQFRTCPSSPNCANTFRFLKQKPKCLKIVNTSIEKIDLKDWVPLPVEKENLKLGGIALCFLGNYGSNPDSRTAIQYFYSGLNFNSNGQPIARKLHFSWDELRSPEEMIWVQPPVKQLYYTVETFTTSCIVPKYGFSFDPVLIITLNGTRITMERNYEEVHDNNFWQKDIEIQFESPGRGPGEYVIHCIGGVWNTTQWTNHTHTFIVKDVVPPYFDNDSVNVTYEEGDVDKVLECDPKGDPQPTFEWNSPSIPGTRITSDNKFIFSKITSIYTDGNYVSCLAKNKFGQQARKEFRIIVKPHVELPPVEPSSSSVGIGLIIGIVCAVLFALLLIAGLVFLYFKFLKLGSQIASYLTYDEIKEFRHGKQKPNTGTATGGAAPTSVKQLSDQRTHDYENQNEEDAVAVDCLPYNSEFEVAKENLFVDFNTVLGSGEYGIVYKGRIRLNARDPNPMAVAVKTVKKNVHISYFKALMSELKIMAYIGHHEHIVNLIGANTTNIKNRDLFVGVELCKTSILKFLQYNRNSFQNLMTQNDYLNQETSFTKSEYQNSSVGSAKAITTLDLIRWAGEIASGMEFLAKKKVIHGDLAARNVLLSFELNAKICDFGLARQLVDYNYIKSSSCPLPWKWMAIESLSQMKFSVNSDCWSYGITLWEIFSLGNVPYPAMAWNMDFVDQLQAGLRMAKPTYANNQIYDMMIECWRENPKERPKFTELKLFFQNLEVN